MARAYGPYEQRHSGIWLMMAEPSTSQPMAPMSAHDSVGELKVLEYLALPECRAASSSSRDTPSVSAALYKYRPWPASSWILASRIDLRFKVGARVTQFPSGSWPTISEWACWEIWRISVLR